MLVVVVLVVVRVVLVVVVEVGGGVVHQASDEGARSRVAIVPGLVGSVGEFAECDPRAASTKPPVRAACEVQCGSNRDASD